MKISINFFYTDAAFPKEAWANLKFDEKYVNTIW